MKTSPVTRIVTAAITTDLTDLATAKNEIGLSAQNGGENDFLSRGISQVSEKVATYCGRTLVAEVVADTFRGRSGLCQGAERDSGLQLSRWPTLKIIMVVENNVTLVEGTDFEVDDKAGILYRLSGSCRCPWWAETVVVTYAAGYAVRGVQSAVVPASGSFTVSVTNAGKFAIDLGVSDADGLAFDHVAAEPGAGQYAVAAGVYTFNAADAEKAVAIDYIWRKTPPDLEEAVLRSVTTRFKGRGRDDKLVSQNTSEIGEQRFWIGNIPGQDGPFPPDIIAMLDGKYRIPEIG